MELIYLMSFFGLDFFNFSGPLCTTYIKIDSRYRTCAQGVKIRKKCNLGKRYCLPVMDRLPEIGFSGTRNQPKNELVFGKLNKASFHFLPNFLVFLMIFHSSAVLSTLHLAKMKKSLVQKLGNETSVKP